MFETKRTTLRPIELKDADAVFAYKSDSETNKYQGWIIETLAEVYDFIGKIPDLIDTPGTWYQLVIIEKESNSIIGDIGIHFIDGDNRQCELGCTLARQHHGKGYASEALRVVLEYLFKDLKKHRIVASIDPKNLNSIKLVEALGFRKEGLFKESLWLNGQWVDDLIYAILNKEWQA